MLSALLITLATGLFCWFVYEVVLACRPQAEGVRIAARVSRREWCGRAVSVIEAGIEEILQAPERWGLVESPEIRRYVCRRFPFVLYYRHESTGVVIYAVMHASRRPGYWKERLS